MTPADLLMQGVELMLFGMGFVFAFLTLLVFAIRGMSLLINRFAPEHESPARPLAPSGGAQGEITPDLIAAIQAAVHQHRNRQR